MAKCKTISFPRRPSFTPSLFNDMIRVTILKYLGVYWNSKLKWNDHVDYLLKQASKALFVIRTLKLFCSKKELITVYHLLIRSIFEYCNPLFIGLLQNETQRLNQFQKRVHKIICGTNCDLNCIGDLTDRRKQQSLLLFMKALCSNHCLCPIMPQVSQFSNRVVIYFSRTNRRLCSFVPYVSNLYNTM